MISRYTSPAMGRLWDEESRLQGWLRVEILICQALAGIGVIPREAAGAISRMASVSGERVREIEKTTRHDVAAFVKAVEESIPGWEAYFHYGVTSTDVVDTAQAVTMRDSIDLIALSLQNLAGRLKEMAAIHRRTPVMGRTHGVHAEPITFGVKFLVWLAEAERNAARLKAARENAAVGCISGAVGTYAFVPPQVEEYVCRELGLKPAKASTQVLQRDRHAEVLFALTVTSSLCEKICLEMRHLQRTEVLEAEEGFGRGQKGSSAMPHKRNPINFEQVCGLCRILRGNLSAALENIPLWHERDISHSSVERVILPDSFILCHHIINKTEKLLGELTVHQDRMKKNIDLTRGLHYSQRLLLHLCSRGVPREKAYSLVQQAAARVWENPAATFREEVAESREIMDLLGEGGLEEIFDPGYFFRYIDDIYARFGMAGE